MLPQAGSPSHLLLTSAPWRRCIDLPVECRVITGCLSSTPIPLLHIEALLPPLRVTLTHQSLSFFERALRLPSTFSIASLARSVQSGLFQDQISLVSPEELSLPRSARCALSRLRCNGHSTLLNSYLHRVGRAETPSCSNCGSESQDLSHLVLDCPV